MQNNSGKGFKMDLQTFKTQLKSIGITKKEFAEKLGLSYTTVNAWGSVQDFPKYVEVILEKWVKADNFDKIIEVVKPYADKDL